MGLGTLVTPGDAMVLVLDASPDAIVAVDADGRIAYANPAVETTFGWSPQELVGRPVEQLVPERLVERHATLRPTFVGSRASRPMGIGLDLTARHRDGREFPVEIALATVDTVEGPLVFATVVDISMRKALALKLDQTNEELRHHVADLERRRHEMELLAQLGERFDTCSTIADAYDLLAEVAPTLFGGDAGALYRPTGTGDRLEAVATWGQPPPLARAFAPSECRALEHGAIHSVVESRGRSLCAHVTEPVGAGLVCVPLAAQGESLGILHVQIRRRVRGRRRAAYLAARRRLTQMLAEHVALALANIQLRATLREQSIRDDLTGLFNRRYMEETLDREIRRAMREGYGVGIVMADLDHFKRYNDSWGHAAGDVVLRTVGRFLLASVRGEDVACRFGGEEFVIILPKAGLADTQRRAEDLRRRLGALHIGTVAPPLSGVTMSFGVAACPEHGTTRDQLMAAADEALYRAKAAGRDRVMVAGLGSPRGFEVGSEVGTEQVDPAAG